MPGNRSFSARTIEEARSEGVVVGTLLERNAREAPDQVFVTFDDGTTWTRSQGLAAAYSAARELRALGVSQGDRVALFMHNGPDILALWWGTALLGAATVPLNTAFRGAALARAIRLSDPSVLVVTSELVPRIDELENAGPLPPCLDPADLRGTAATSPDGLPAVNLWDDQMLIMTSGTTGPSKLARVSYLHPYAGWASILMDEGCTPDDVHQIDLPLFHMAAVGNVYACLVTRTRMRVRARPALDRYWQAVCEDGITGGLLLGTVGSLLLSRSPNAAERDHRIRFLITVPLPADVAAFKRRFRIPKLLAPYGSTETSAPMIGEGVPGLAPGFCGRVRPGWEVRLVDSTDQDVPVGTVGEAIIRAGRPFVMSSGYFNDVQATARAWRQGWFHTDDLLRADEEGNFYFVDRSGDALRRRGENISAFEVESGVATHPAVAEAACVPVPSDSGVEHEVKAWIVARPGVEVDFVDLLAHCARELPHFMVPRYFELIDELPKTPSAKVQKYLLRQRGNTASTWDGRQHGLVVTRRGLEKLEKR